MRSGATTADVVIDDVLDLLSRTDDSELVELVELVAQICDSAAAGVTIRRGPEYHVAITHGIDPLVCSSEDTFCRYTMGTEGVFVVEDAQADGRFSSIGFVDGSLAHARFYASAPIYAPTGQMVGRLCVIDPEPKTLNPLQRRSLETLALSVTKVIELRLLKAARVSRVSHEARQTAATLMSQLSAELSHDLRVPLTAIMASAEMLQDQLDDHPDPAPAALLNRTMAAARRMERMLDQHMGHEHVLSERSVHEVDLLQLAGQLRLDSAPMLDAAGAVVEIGHLPVLRADPDDMYSVLQNLVTNAVKFARPDAPPRVHLSSRQVPGGWRISVRDNGVGIPEDRRVEVFSLFSRGHTDVPGHGIGLATVQRIVSAHGGHVGVGETAAGGAEIWFELPSPGAGENVRDDVSG